MMARDIGGALNMISHVAAAAWLCIPVEKAIH